MKRVILLIGDRRSPSASGFVKAFEEMGGKLDAVLLLTPGRSRGLVLRALLKPLKALRPGKLKERMVDLICAMSGRQRLSSLKASWNVPKGENSWDLLPPGIDLVEHARSRNIPVHTTPSLGSGEIGRLCDRGPAVFVFYAGGILPEAALDVHGAEFLNAHMGPMPRYRGMNVVEWAVLEGSVPKVSVLLMDRGIDNGDMILEREINVKGARTIAELRRAGYLTGCVAMAEAAYGYARGEIQAQPQSSGARYCYRMHGALREKLESKLQKGMAR